MVFLRWTRCAVFICVNSFTKKLRQNGYFFPLFSVFSWMKLHTWKRHVWSIVAFRSIESESYKKMEEPKPLTFYVICTQFRTATYTAYNIPSFCKITIYKLMLVWWVLWQMILADYPESQTHPHILLLTPSHSQRVIDRHSWWKFKFVGE